MNQSARRVLHGLALIALSMTAACASFGRHRPQITAPEAEVLANVLDEVLASLADSAVVCLRMMSDAAGGAPSVEPILPLLQTARRVVREADCPPTYTRMFLIVDSLGRPIDPPRPPGYVDPHRIQLSRPQFVAPYDGLVEVQRYQGTGGHQLRCVIVRMPAVPSIKCEEYRWWVH